MRKILISIVIIVAIIIVVVLITTREVTAPENISISPSPTIQQ